MLVIIKIKAVTTSPVY